MITASDALLISNNATLGLPTDGVRSVTPIGNNLLDELNMAVQFAAMSGRTTTYLPITKYPEELVENCIDILTGLGYVVNTDRLRSYRELFVSWE